MSKITVDSLCSCGSCSDAVFRAIGIVEKQLLDSECTIFISAVGIAMSAVASDIMSKQIESMIKDKGMPGLIASPMAENMMADTMNTISDVIREWYVPRVGKADHPVTLAVNAAIANANKRHAEEKNLPKGD